MEAKMGKLVIQKHKFFKNNTLKKYWDILPDETMRYNKMSKSLQLMNKNPDREVKAALHAGEKTGTTDVLVTVNTHFPAHLVMSFDNEGVPITGRARKGFGMRHSNFLGLGDTLLSGYTYGKEFSGKYAYHSIPVGYNGASLLYGWNYSKSSPKEEYTKDILRSSIASTSLSLHRDIYKENGEYLGEVSTGFNTSDKSVTQNTGVYSHDKLRIVTLGGTYVKNDSQGITIISPELDQGLDAFSATSRGNPRASRNAKSAFTKFLLTAQRRTNLPHNMQGNLKLRTQLTSSKLMPQEELGIGGIDSVRGYPPSDFNADNAAIFNAELLIPATFIPKSWYMPYANEPLRQQVTALLFTDYGWGMLKGAPITQTNTVNDASTGAGLRIRFYNQALMRLEWGFPFGMHAATAGGNNRFHFSVDFQDKLPEEVERMQKINESNNIEQWSWKLIDAELNAPNSKLRKQLDAYLAQANDYRNRGMLKEAKAVYKEMNALSQSIYEQTKEYIKNMVITNKKLEEENELALAAYREGKLEDAKRMWQNILLKTKLQPLTLEYQ